VAAPTEPLKLTVWGLSDALSVSVSAPVRFPLAVGVNVTLIVQLPDASTELAQLLVWAKSPLAVIVRLVKVPLPVLVKVIDCGALVVETDGPEKARLLGESLTIGATPVPLKVTDCGLLAAYSLKVSAPLTGPEEMGRKLTLTVQLPLAATEGRQLLLCVQPFETVRLVMLRGRLPVFVKVTCCGALVVPATWLLKFRFAGETSGAGRMPVPFSWTT